MESDHVVERGVAYKNRGKRMASLTFAQKRNLTIFAFSMRMFFMGVEYAVIFPSVWDYLKRFHVDYWYLGLVLSAYNMVGIVSTIIVGKLADTTRQIRLTGFLWNLTEIAGNIIYALHFHVTFPLFGRMVAGFGEGYISAMWGELARVTTKEQRTRYFTILKGSNLLGAAIGPSMDLFLKEFNFYIGSWHIDFRTAPGFFMGVVWIFVTLFMIIFVFDLSSEMKSQHGYESLEPESSDKIENGVLSPRYGAIAPREPGTRIVDENERSGDDEEEETVVEAIDETCITGLQTNETGQTGQENEKNSKMSWEMSDTSKGSWELEETGKTSIRHHENGATEVPSDKNDNTEFKPRKPVTFTDALRDMFLKFEVKVLVYLLFFMYITHTCLQAITPLVADKMLDWSETKVSIVYTIWGLEIIVVLVIVWLVSAKIGDRVILLTGVIFGTLASISLIILSFSTSGSNLCYYSLLVTIFLGGVGISITVVVGRSLVSKHTQPENQGLVHAILTSFNRIAGLIGPIFGSSLYTHKTIMGCMVAVMQVVGLILVLAAFQRLKVVKKS